MSQFNKFAPRDIDIDSGEKHKKFLQLTEENISPFYKKTMKQVFMFALGMGFKNKKRMPLKKREGIIPVRSLNATDIAILQAVAISEKRTVDVLFGENIPEIVKIAEEYANAGIDMLYCQIFNPEPGDIDRRLEQPLREIVGNIGKL